MSCNNGNEKYKIQQLEDKLEEQSNQIQEIQEQSLLDKLERQENDDLKSTSFEILNVSKYNPDRLQYQGKVIYEKSWQDFNGENIVLFTTNKEELFVYHYAVKNKNVRQLRKVYDFEKNCDADLLIKFIERSIVISDLDQDNYGEITFAYKKGCRSDVSPLTLKLLTLENGEKYIIRGSTLIDFGGGAPYGGEKNIDPSFYNAPKSFLRSANIIWRAIVKERF